ncbi:MAG: transposase, partial [Verrucomicrobiota bacterium]
TPKSRAQHPGKLRRVVMLVEVDGREEEMTFITNNLEWSPRSIGDLYRSRWGIEVFFKQIKQTLQICDFLGHNKEAIRWQMWSALLLYILLRFQAWQSKWHHSFTRAFTLIRGIIWDRLNMHEVFKFYGTAGGSFRMLGSPQQAYLPGIT